MENDVENAQPSTTPVRRGRPSNASRIAELEAENKRLDTVMGEPATPVRGRSAQRSSSRRRKASANEDKFYIDPSIIPDGMTYEYKRLTYGGKEDRDHQIDLADNGWEPVPADRHPELTGAKVRTLKHDPGAEMILKGGLVLMERPKELTQEARAEDAQVTRLRKDTQFRRLHETQKGQLDRTVKTVSRNYEAMEVPDDE